VSGVQVYVDQAKSVINLVTGESLKIADGKVTLDLVNEPAALLAIDAPADAPGVRVTKSARDVRFDVGENPAIEADKHPAHSALPPVQVSLIDPSNQTRATFFRRDAHYTFADSDAGTWKAIATNLVSGAQSVATFDVKDDAREVTTISPDVFVTHPDRLSRFLARHDDVRIIVEASQLDALAQAEQLAAAMTKAGRPTKVLQIDDTRFDTYWLRWVPRKLDARVMDAIDRDEVIGFRGNMQAFIQKSTRAHIPEKGGWTDNTPAYIVRKDVILFSGGRLAESVRACNDWLPTANTPGHGRANLTVALSPFWAGKDAIVLASRDVQGRDKAVDVLLSAIAKGPDVTSADAQPDVGAPLQKFDAKVAAADAVAQIARPLKGFVPPAFVKNLDASQDGFASVTMKDRTVVVSPDGQVVRTLPPGGEATLISAGGHLFRVQPDVLTSSASWYFTTSWRVGLDHFDAAGLSEKLSLAGTFQRAAGYPKDWQNAFAISRDGQTFFTARLGNGYVLFDLSGKTHRVFQEPGTSLGFYETVRDPVFPTGAAFSADTSHVVVTAGHFPTGYGGMGGPPLYPLATSIRVIDVKTGAIVWRRDANDFFDHSLASVNNCLAISNAGRRVAYIDSWLNAVLLDESGKELLRHAPVTYNSSGKNLPVPLRVEMTPDASTICWIFPGHVLISDVDGKQQSLFPIANVSDVRLAQDGGRVFIADVDGLITCLDRAGKSLWTFQTQGDRAKLAVTTSGLLVGEGQGNLILLDAAGKEARRTLLADSSIEAPKLAPVRFNGPAVYREPSTLEILKKHALKEVARWKPDGAKFDAFDKSFYLITQDATLSAPAEGQALVHLVYRHSYTPADPKATSDRALQTQPPSVVVEAGGKTQEFVLDMATPEYRVVDLPVHGAGPIKVKVKAMSDIQIAELSIHGFKIAGVNGASIASASLDVRTGLTPPDDLPEESVEPGLDVLDDTDASSIAKAAAGKMKNVKIFSVNTDVDRVAGAFFTSSGNPLESFDGQHFLDGKPSAWTKWAAAPGALYSSMGSMIVIDLGYTSHTHLCALYARTLKQSEVMKGIAIIKAVKGDLTEAGTIVQDRRVLDGVIENDQFFNLFPLTGAEMKALAVYVFGGEENDHGLSEVELYD